MHISLGLFSWVEWFEINATWVAKLIQISVLHDSVISGRMHGRDYNHNFILVFCALGL